MQDPNDLDPRRLFSRKFVPMDADMGDWAQIEPLFKVLLHQKPASIKGLEKWLLDRSELTSAILEEGVKRYFSMTTQTDDSVREHAYQRFIEDIEPKSSHSTRSWTGPTTRIRIASGCPQADTPSWIG